MTGTSSGQFCLDFWTYDRDLNMVNFVWKNISP